MIQADRVSKSMDGKPILKEVGFHVPEGSFFGIIGPNGSGKSTLLKLISGVEPVSSGEVRVRDKRIAEFPRKELARQLAVLPQDSLPQVGFTVREVLELGRYPFQDWLGRETADPSQLIDGVVEKLGLQKLENRSISVLSGGERQRVALGKTMVQEPRIVLLDEPTTYLDIGYQIQMMDYVREWQRDCGLTVVAVLHDLNLAAMYCDRVLVLHEGMALGVGTPEEMLKEELLERVYGTKPLILPHPVSGVPQILLQPGSV